MCLSMRMRRSSGLQMRMNEWFREGAGYYSFFVSHMLVSEGMLCTASLIFFFRFYFIILNKIACARTMFSFLRFLRNQGREGVYFDVL